MATKALKLNKQGMNYLVWGAVLFIALSLLIPMLLPVTVDSSDSLINFVDFWTKSNAHLGTYWMFYAIILALLKFLPKKVSKKSPLSKQQLQFIIGAVVVFVLLSLIVPLVFPLAELAEGSSLIGTVTFFTNAGNHISTYWMFYTVIAAIWWFRPGKR